MHRSHVRTGAAFPMQAVLMLFAVTWLLLCVSELALCVARAMICVQLVEWRVSAKAGLGRVMGDVMVVSSSPGFGERIGLGGGTSGPTRRNGEISECARCPPSEVQNKSSRPGPLRMQRGGEGASGCSWLDGHWAGQGDRAPSKVECESLFGGRIVSSREAPPCNVQPSGVVDSLSPEVA
jgi:hypothetical protein